MSCYHRHLSYHRRLLPINPSHWLAQLSDSLFNSFASKATVFEVLCSLFLYYYAQKETPVLCSCCILKWKIGREAMKVLEIERRIRSSWISSLKEGLVSSALHSMNTYTELKSKSNQRQTILSFFFKKNIQTTTWGIILEAEITVLTDSWVKGETERLPVKENKQAGGMLCPLKGTCRFYLASLN